MNPIPYRIVDIKVTEFSCQKEVSRNSVNIQTNFQFQVSVATHSFKCISIYDYILNEEKVMTLVLECVFVVEPTAFDNLKQKDKIELDIETLQYFATICVGTARGEIHARCEEAESMLATVVLPPINLTKVITTPAIFQI